MTVYLAKEDTLIAEVKIDESNYEDFANEVALTGYRIMRFVPAKDKKHESDNASKEFKPYGSNTFKFIFDGKTYEIPHLSIELVKYITSHVYQSGMIFDRSIVQEESIANVDLYGDYCISFCDEHDRWIMSLITNLTVVEYLQYLQASNYITSGLTIRVRLMNNANTKIESKFAGFNSIGFSGSNEGDMFEIHRLSLKFAAWLYKHTTPLKSYSVYTDGGIASQFSLEAFNKDYMGDIIANIMYKGKKIASVYNMNSSAYNYLNTIAEQYEIFDIEVVNFKEGNNLELAKDKDAIENDKTDNKKATINPRAHFKIINTNASHIMYLNNVPFDMARCIYNSAKFYDGYKIYNSTIDYPEDLPATKFTSNTDYYDIFYKNEKIFSVPLDGYYYYLMDQALASNNDWSMALAQPSQKDEQEKSSEDKNLNDPYVSIVFISKEYYTPDPIRLYIKDQELMRYIYYNMELGSAFDKYSRGIKLPTIDIPRAATRSYSLYYKQKFIFRVYLNDDYHNKLLDEIRPYHNWSMIDTYNP